MKREGKSRNNKNSVKFSSFEEETIVFNNFLSKKPKNYTKEEYLDKSFPSRIIIFSWITGENRDYSISVGKANNFLGKYGYTLQLYFDIVILNLTNISQRPKCLVCGKEIKFNRFNRGYAKTCCKDCCNTYKKLVKLSNITKEEDLFIFNKFYELNVNKGIPYTDYYYESDKVDQRGKTIRYYKLYSQISGEKEDRYVQSNSFPRILYSFGMTSQVYFDLVILGITKIEDRPKCKICGKSVKFGGLFEGYDTTCSNECFIKLSTDRINIVNKLPLSIEARNKISKKVSESIKRRGANKNKFENGYVHSNIFGKDIHYDSSWERKFIIICESLYKKGHILEFSRCKDIIEYLKDDGSIHRYLPDFKIILSNGIKVVIELKPANLLKTDRVVYLKKMAAMKHYKKQKIKYIILTENELFKNIHGSFNIFDYIV